MSANFLHRPPPRMFAIVNRTAFWAILLMNSSKTVPLSDIREDGIALMTISSRNLIWSFTTCHVKPKHYLSFFLRFRRFCRKKWHSLRKLEGIDKFRISEVLQARHLGESSNFPISGIVQVRELKNQGFLRELGVDELRVRGRLIDINLFHGQITSRPWKLYNELFFCMHLYAFFCMRV